MRTAANGIAFDLRNFVLCFCHVHRVDWKKGENTLVPQLLKYSNKFSLIEMRANTPYAFRKGDNTFPFSDCFASYCAFTILDVSTFRLFLLDQQNQNFRSVPFRDLRCIIHRRSVFHPRPDHYRSVSQSPFSQAYISVNI